MGAFAPALDTPGDGALEGRLAAVGAIPARLRETEHALYRPPTTASRSTAVSLGIFKSSLVLRVGEPTLR